jgi:hypothetical protein
MEKMLPEKKEEQKTGSKTMFNLTVFAFGDMIVFSFLVNIALEGEDFARAHKSAIGCTQEGTVVKLISGRDQLIHFG